MSSAGTAWLCSPRSGNGPTSGPPPRATKHLEPTNRSSGLANFWTIEFLDPSGSKCDGDKIPVGGVGEPLAAMAAQDAGGPVGSLQVLGKYRHDDLAVGDAAAHPP